MRRLSVAVSFRVLFPERGDDPVADVDHRGFAPEHPRVGLAVPAFVDELAVDQVGDGVAVTGDFEARVLIRSSVPAYRMSSRSSPILRLSILASGHKAQRN